MNDLLQHILSVCNDQEVPRVLSVYRQFAEIERSASDVAGAPESTARLTRSSTRRVQTAYVEPALVNVGTQAPVRVRFERDEYEVEALLSRRLNASKKSAEYLVKWKGYDHIHNSWESIDRLNCHDLLEEFESQRSSSVSIESEFIARGIKSFNRDVVQYLDTKFFVVPHGFGIPNRFCVVGPNKAKDQFLCKCSNPYVAQHHHHASVVRAFVAKDSADAITKFLPNYGVTPGLTIGVSTTTAVDPYPLSTSKISVNFGEDMLEAIGEFSLKSARHKQLKPSRPEGLCDCPEPTAYSQEAELVEK